MSSSITGVSSSTTTTGAATTAQVPSTASSGSDLVANKETFLKLLVAQLKNQDPLNPMDGMQFVGQLAQFSQLEQLMGIREDLAKTASTQTPAATTNSTTTTP